MVNVLLHSKPQQQPALVFQIDGVQLFRKV
jgi:hypothetical protein